MRSIEVAYVLITSLIISTVVLYTMAMVPPRWSAVESHCPRQVHRSIRVHLLHKMLHTELEMIASGIAVESGRKPCPNIRQCREYSDKPRVLAMLRQAVEQTPRKEK